MRASRRLLPVAILVVGPLVIASCVAHGVAPTASQGGASIAPTRPAPTIAVTSEPTINTPPSDAPPTAAALPEPPAASIVVEGGDPVVGELGSFSWNNAGSASPGLDGSPIHVGAREPMTLSLAEPVGIAGWQVSRVLPGNHDRVGAIGMGDGSGGRVAFQAPPDGTWSVEVRVEFAGNLGSAAYYWRMEVD
jgi:hypothetical protein